MKYILSLITKQGGLFVNPISKLFCFLSDKELSKQLRKNIFTFFEIRVYISGSEIRN